MDIEDVFRDFSTAESNLPVEALRWALDNWQVAAPRFVRHLDDFTNGRISGKAAWDAAFYIFHLLGEKRESSAFVTMCAFLKHPDLPDQALGDAVNSTLKNILIAAFDGEPSTLQAVVECESADEYVRNAALQALSYLSFTGAAPQLDMRAYMLELHGRMRPRATNFIWVTWALEVANLGYADFADKVKWLFDEGFIDNGILRPMNFAKALERTLADPKRAAGFEDDQIGPFTDTIGQLSKWHGFSEQRKVEEAERQARLAAKPFVRIDVPPVSNPMRRVGRNDPCPCGSGKKYKKCCLG